MASSRRIMRLMSALAALALGGCSAAANEPVEITVDPSRGYQLMTGWEATTRLWEYDKPNDRYDGSWMAIADRIFDGLVNDVGINRLRLELKSGAENPVDYWAKFAAGEIGYAEFKRHYYEKINDDADPLHLNPAGVQFSHLDWQIENIVLPIRRRLEARGEKLYLNLNYVDFGSELKGNLSHALAPAEYAELVHAAFDHLRRKYGLVPDALEIILEPDNTEHWRGRQIGEAIVAVSKRLKPAGFAPEITAPSTASAGRAPGYIDEMLAVPGAAALVSTLSYHRYDRPKPAIVVAIADRAQAIGLSNRLVERVAPIPGIAGRARERRLSTAMLEHLTGDAAELHEDLTEGQVSAWQQYAIASRSPGGTPDQGGAYYMVDNQGPRSGVLRLGTRTPGLAQYFRYVRFGARRIEARSSEDGVRPVAFRNADGRFVVVVASRRAATMAVRGLPAGRYAASYTTDREIARELPPLLSDGTISVRLPSAGIVTIRQAASARREATADCPRRASSCNLNPVNNLGVVGKWAG